MATYCSSQKHKTDSQLHTLPVTAQHDHRIKTIELNAQQKHKLVEIVKKATALRFQPAPWSTELSSCLPELPVYRQEVLQHSCLLIFKALPIRQLQPRERNYLFWYLGSQFGTPTRQNKLGDQLGRVENIKGDGFHARGFQSCKKLEMHTDRGDIICLMSVRPAGKSGGKTAFASAQAIYDRLQNENPELIRPLEQGFYYAMPYRGEETTNYRVPVISTCDGVISFSLVRFFVEYAAELRKEPLTRLEVSALDRFDELANSPGVKVVPELEPGDMVVWNNHTWLHGRTAFADGVSGQRRLLLRLWLSAEGEWPLCPALVDYTNANNFMKLPDSPE